MKDLFIVNTESGTQVITAGVLANELKDKLSACKSVKRVDVESLARDTVHNNCGQAFTEDVYKTMVDTLSESLIAYSSLTPYVYYTNVYIPNSK